MTFKNISLDFLEKATSFKLQESTIDAKNILQYENGIYQLINLFIKSNKNIDYLINKDLFKFHIEKINAVHNIPTSNAWMSKYIPDNIKEYILDKSTFLILCKFKIESKNIEIINVTDDIKRPEIFELIEKFRNVAVWLFMAEKYSSKSCAKNLKIYLYESKFKKLLPDNNSMIIGPQNVNTGVSDICQNSSEIVIYRKEEWFKVLIHETFHSFGLDFVEKNNEDKKKLYNIFPISIDIYLFETYTETWANIINTLFCSYHYLKIKTNKINVKKLHDYFSFFIKIEQIFSLLQVTKILQFMGLKYKNLYGKSEKDKLLRENLYRENSNVFAYFILKTILLNNYILFISWCVDNNNNLLQFSKKTSSNLSFINLIKENYKSKTYLDNLKKANKFIEKNPKFSKTARMTILELNN